MKGFVADIEDLDGRERRLSPLAMGKNPQLVLMGIEPGGEIGDEVHDDRDQFFRAEK